MSRRNSLLVLSTLVLFVACRSDDGDTKPESQVSAPSVEGRIIVAGEEVPISARVVTWRDPGGFDAHRERCWFDGNRIRPSDPAAGCDTDRRYGTRKTGGMDPEVAARVAAEGWNASTLRDRVQHFVLHYDVCVTSTRCFRVLHDQRGLSVHFLLDVDGTIYQTLDLVHRARHAGWTNDTSIGIEIAHIGSYPLDDESWRRFYREDDAGLRVEAPADFNAPAGLHRPARPGLFRDRINGADLQMVDYTEAQYRSLEALVDALAGYFPRLPKAVPRDDSGAVIRDEMTRAELEAFRGIIGHNHVTRRKTDPGPAMDWDRLVRAR